MFGRVGFGSVRFGFEFGGLKVYWFLIYMVRFWIWRLKDLSIPYIYDSVYKFIGSNIPMGPNFQVSILKSKPIAEKKGSALCKWQQPLHPSSYRSIFFNNHISILHPTLRPQPPLVVVTTQLWIKHPLSHTQVLYLGNILKYYY